MDYSLLFAVEMNMNYQGLYGNNRTKSVASESIDAEDMEQFKKSFDKTRHSFMSKTGKYTYHLGIIDYLQDFNLEK